MRSRWPSALSLWSATALVGTFVACDRSPTSPRAAPAGSTSMPTGIEIAGPASVPPGQTAQYFATARLANGSSRDVTAEAVWGSTNVGVLSVTGGLATGHQRGEADIRAAIAGLTSARRVLVLPAGTFRLSGRVHDAGIPVSGAQVDVTAGSAQGLRGLSIAGGQYALHGVSGETGIRVTMDGYLPRTERVRVTDHQLLDIELELARPRPDIAGRYTLTISAAGNCRPDLPEEAWVRRYRAELTRDSSDPTAVTVTLTGGTFARGLNRFSGRVGPTTAQFGLGGFFYHPPLYFDFPEVLEQLTPTTYYVPAGLADAAITPEGLSGALRGHIELRTGNDPRAPVSVARCWSDNHSVVFAR